MTGGHADSPVSTVDVFDAPSADGKSGYRGRLVPDNLGVSGFSASELHVRATGLSDGPGAAGLWIAPGHMPLLGPAPVRADYAYRTGGRSSSTATVPCPRFVRHSVRVSSSATVRG